MAEFTLDELIDAQSEYDASQAKRLSRFPRGKERSLLSEIGKGGIKGVAGTVDLPGFVVNTVKNVALPTLSKDIPDVPYFGDYVGTSLDKIDKTHGLPYTLPQQALGTAAQFASGARAFKKIPGGNIVPDLIEKYGKNIPGGKRLSKAFQDAVPENLRDYTQLGSMGAGAGIASHYSEDSPLAALSGAVLGAGAHKYTPMTLRSLPKIASALKSPRTTLNTLAKHNMLAGVDNSALPVHAAGKRLGVDLRPSEASSSRLAAGREGNIGTTHKGDILLHEHHTKRLGQEQTAVSGLMKQVYHKETVADDAARNVAKKIIQRKIDIRKKKAEPLYEKAYEDMISASTGNRLMEDSIIANAASKVAKDPIYGNELKKVGKKGDITRSVRFWDLTKKNIDADIEAAKTAKDNASVKFLSESKDKLLKTLDRNSPAYNQARKVFAEDSPAIDKLRKGSIGKIAAYDDLQTKRTVDDIFDLKQTDIKKFNKIRDEYLKESPDTWQRIVRQRMQNALVGSEAGGSVFYDKLLKDKRSYKQLHNALSYDKNAQKKLADMRIVFRNIIPQGSLKKSASASKMSDVNMIRNSGDIVRRAANYFTRGAYDKAAVEVITNPNWDSEFKDIMRTTRGKPQERAVKFSMLLHQADKNASNKAQGDTNRDAGKVIQPNPESLKTADQFTLEELLNAEKDASRQRKRQGGVVTAKIMTKRESLLDILKRHRGEE
jgi:hypothetical protein